MSLRSRARRAAVRVGRRLLRMEADAAPGAPRRERDVDGTAPIPAVVDGSGDTPGPNHKHDIGRTWVAAQLLGGEGIVVLDVRNPEEWASGTLPGALCVPGPALPRHLDLLPPPEADLWVAVVDAIGGDRATEVARQLREAGWARARRLVGGFAEWLEEGEEVAAGPPGEVGRTVQLAGGRRGTIWRVEDTEPRYRILVDNDEAIDAREGELTT